MLEVESIEAGDLTLHLEDLFEARHCPEVHDALHLLVIEQYLTVIVDAVVSISMFTVLARRQLVHHGTLRQKEGSLAHLIGLVQQLELESVDADCTAQLLEVVMRQHHTARAHLAKQHLCLLTVDGNDGLSALLEDLLDVVT